MKYKLFAITVLMVLSVIFTSRDSVAQEVDLGKYSDFTPYQEQWLTGEPRNPSMEWLVAYGGRLYDNWYEMIGRSVPSGTHPSYPENGKKKGAETWRCKECHGWDYFGAAGAYGDKSSSHYTGIKGIRAYDGGKPLDVVKILRDKNHKMSTRDIPKYAAERLALFVTMGQIKSEENLDANGAPKGNAENGVGVYENLCAICHGYDGKAIDFDGGADSEFIGTIADDNPIEMMHKMRSGQPGAIMPPFRWMDTQMMLDIIAYSRTLPAE